MRGLASLVVLSIVCGASVARAGDPAPALPLTLIWDGGVCDGKQPTEDAVLRLVGAEAKGAAPVTSTVRIRRAGKALQVTLTTQQLGETGERSFEASSCDHAVDAVALVLSVMLSPPGAAETLEAEGATIAPPSRREPAPDRPRPEPIVTEPEPTAFAIGVGPRLGGDALMLPDPTLYAGAGAWLEGSGWRVALTASVWVPRTEEAGPNAASRADVGLAAILVEGCVRLFDRVLLADACLGAELGRATGAARGIANPETAAAPWVAAVPGVALRSSGRPLSAVVSLGFPVAIVRPEFEIDGYGRVYRAPLVGARGAVGADWVFP